mmetsp:Transcript_24620/g.70695  ORF Transcript_24620/g.70695 Transcript_24620/m.70695 type:complete len:252 (-) Transcript_24620:28-783(-)
MASEADSNFKTDTSIATGKITTATTDSSTTSMKPVRSDDERSLEGDLQIHDEDHDAFPDLPDFTPPLRIDTAKLGLANSFATLEIPRKLEKEIRQKARRRKSDPKSGHRSGSRSPAFDGGSSISSLEDMGIDTDVLTDKMGILELDWKEQQEHAERLNKSCSNLPPVSERMSEESLDDVHAFSNIKPEGHLSRGGSIATGGEVSSNVLEPLDEGDEEDDNDEEGKVKIMNMEDILEGPEEDAQEAAVAPTI